MYATKKHSSVLNTPIAVDCSVDFVCGKRVDDDNCIPVYCEDI